MPVYIYNSLSRKKEEFTPLDDNRIGIYVCGPTVYDYPHIGHAKSYVSFDVVVRYFRYLGYKVRYVQNITDVGHLLDGGEDRIQMGAKREKLEPMELVERYTRAYFEAMDKLNVQRPDIAPHAAGHIPEQIEFVQRLLEAGYAYEVNGSVYFDISKWQSYGKLSGRKVEEQQAGARVEVSSEKKHPADFALWKKADPEHIMKWKSPWSIGYPGWHIECSTMSMKYLGETFDIHGGGMENQFPHHECEIAQAEAATGKSFARYWMHNNMVLVDGVKMSKSLGNFTTVGKALEKYSGEQIRFFILQSHYRSPVDFTDDAIQAAGQGLGRIFTTINSLQKAMANAEEGELLHDIDSLCMSYRSKFEQEMNDDFNTPGAIGVLFDFCREINKRLKETESLTGQSIVNMQKTVSRLAGDVLGILPTETQEEISAQPFIDLLVELRSRLREQKYFELSDYLRDRLTELGIEIKDSKEGTSWTYKL